MNGRGPGLPPNSAVTTRVSDAGIRFRVPRGKADPVTRRARYEVNHAGQAQMGTRRERRSVKSRGRDSPERRATGSAACGKR